MSDLEKGKILGYWECQMPLAQIAAAVGRNRQTVKSFVDRYERLIEVELKQGSPI